MNDTRAGLTSHVLDIARGMPGRDVGIELFRLGRDRQLLTSTRTNADGRTDAPLMHIGSMEPGVYELRFAVGEYFARAGLAMSEPRFLDVVSIEFGLLDPDGHYHVPLLASPWSYSSYRGAVPSHVPDDRLPDPRAARLKQERAPPTAAIADNRAGSPDNPPGTGGPGVTTHVIDIARGCGASHLRVDVLAVDGTARRHLKSVRTNREGRTDEWLVGAGRLTAGIYELVFNVGEYFEQGGVVMPPIRFFDVARVTVGLDPARGHYHIPLLIAPWGYSVYRGS
jgi:5-hydroxyisourate hydrolase